MFTADCVYWYIESSLTLAEIPSLVTSIGQGAFCRCSSLISIRIPSSVTTFGEGFFQGCSSLTSIEIPCKATTIGEFVFQDCSSLEEAAKHHNIFQRKNITEGILFVGAGLITLAAATNAFLDFGTKDEASRRDANL
jgi:hypothetical protein